MADMWCFLLDDVTSRHPLSIVGKVRGRAFKLLCQCVLVLGLEE